MNTAGHPIKNIVFDMGGVLMTWDAPYFATRFSDNEEDATLLHAAYFGRGEWALLDAGVITYPTMLRIAEAHLPERLWPNLHDMAAHWARYSEPIPEVNDLARHLYEQGYDLYLLSNAGTRIDERLNERIDERFGERPAGSERYGLVPAECLFVDDNADNCAGAKVAGMQAFHFTGDAAALAAAIDVSPQR